jgi:hypothetical protein
MPAVMPSRVTAADQPSSHFFTANAVPPITTGRILSKDQMMREFLSG